MTEASVRIGEIPEDIRALPGAADGDVELVGVSGVPEVVERMAGFRPTRRTAASWMYSGVWLGGDQPWKLASAKWHGNRWTTERAIREFLAGNTDGDCFVLDETPVSMAEAAAMLRTFPENVSRYARDGVSGVRLESARLGGRRLTSREAVERFRQRTSKLNR